MWSCSQRPFSDRGALREEEQPKFALEVQVLEVRPRVPNSKEVEVPKYEASVCVEQMALVVMCGGGVEAACAAAAIVYYIPLHIGCQCAHIICRHTGA